MSQSDNQGAKLLETLADFLKDRFNLEEDKASERDTISEIQKGVVFRGTNLWILIFAILVCSVGLNVNSTAVIIGAMLISPLMGPIMGIGVGVGINDFELIIKALKNIGIAAALSVLTSMTYFFISPLSDVQSELLARTQPTLWDVLIAFFGGLAGIIAGSRKEKSNAIPGVAIATALMPPLCTAGFGLATGNWNFFFGAFYLFFINGVFISLATFLIVRFLRFHKKQFEEPAREKRVKQYIMALVLVTIIPSVYTAYRVVQRSVFEQKANLFINRELDFEKCKIIGKHLFFSPDSSAIEVTLFGEIQEKEEIAEREKKLADFGLENTKLIINQAYSGEQGLDVESLAKINQDIKTGVIEELYRRNEEELKSKDEKIAFLEKELINARGGSFPVEELGQEIKAIHKNVVAFSLSKNLIAELDSEKKDTVLMAYIKYNRKPSRTEIETIEDFLKVRTKSDRIKLITETN